jgi:hypothetical protein
MSRLNFSLYNDKPTEYENNVLASFTWERERNYTPATITTEFQSNIVSNAHLCLINSVTTVTTTSRNAKTPAAAVTNCVEKP